MPLGALALASILTASAHGQPALAPAPPLPAVVVESFPADARTSITAALTKAQATPGNATAVGGLGITLQAWEQWEAAHTAYRRAQVLAPEAPEWWHLDGLVLLRLARYGEAATAFDAALQRKGDFVASLARLAESRF